MSVLWIYRQQCSQLLSRCLSLSLTTSKLSTSIHVAARQSPYPGTKDVNRATVPDERVPWSVKWVDYKPIEYTAKKVFANPPWADTADPREIQHFNEHDGKIDRTSFTGQYEIDKISNRPKNPIGRTGLSGRGLLGRWGPNHAGDSILTRWAKDQHDGKSKVLDVLLITRKDSGILAFAGGMVDKGENVSTAIKREFIEEAMNSNFHDNERIEKLFKHANTIYQGYVDDPRNTDNSWMETVAVNIHDKTGALIKDLRLEAGDDATKVEWIRLDRRLHLYASHEYILRIVVKQLGAYEYWHD